MMNGCIVCKSKIYQILSDAMMRRQCGQSTYCSHAPMWITKDHHYVMMSCVSKGATGHERGGIISSHNRFCVPPIFSRRTALRFLAQTPQHFVLQPCSPGVCGRSNQLAGLIRVAVKRTEQLVQPFVRMVQRGICALCCCWIGSCGTAVDFTVFELLKRGTEAAAACCCCITQQ